MFCDAPLCLWMFREKDDIIILAKAIGEKPMERQMMKPLQDKTCEGFSVAQKWKHTHRSMGEVKRGDAYA